jgi:hypothetical protein
MTTAQDGGKVVSLTHRPLLPPENTPGTYFCYRLSRPLGHSATERIMSLKISNYNIGNRTRDLPVCSVVPYPLRHRAPLLYNAATLKCHHFLFRNLGVQMVDGTPTVHICLLYSCLMYNRLVCKFLYVTIF